MAGRRPGESSDELTEIETASPFDPTSVASSNDAPGPLLVTPLSTARPLPPPPSVNMTAMSEPSVSAPPDPDLVRGDVLGDYVIESKIGRGGMGDVYLGVHRVIRKRAAIKLLRGDYCRDHVSVTRFMTEARIVNEIGHPNIVDVFAFGETPDGRHYLVMEFLQGESLRARLARGRIDLDELCAIARPLVRALAAAHAKGVVHRDLKPDNVFLHAIPGEPATVKLLDFGIAKLSRPDQEAQQQTASGVLVGTPMYIAPEQARGQGVDHRADIYTLGGMLFEMVTGRPPFLAATAVEVVAKHLLEPAVRPSSLGPIPRELDDLIFGMLSKELAARPSLAEVATVLERFADDARRPTTEVETPRDSVASIAVTSRRPASQPTPPVAPRSAATARPRHRWRVLLPVLVVVSGAAAYGIVRTVSHQPSPAGSAEREMPVTAPATSPVAAPAETTPPTAAQPTQQAAPPTPPATPLPAAAQPTQTAPTTPPKRHVRTTATKAPTTAPSNNNSPKAAPGTAPSTDTSPSSSRTRPTDTDDEELLPRGSVPKAP